MLMKRSLVFVVLLSLPFSAHAKELANRLGIGFKDQFTYSIPSIAAQYYPNSDTAVSAALGLDTEKDRSKFGFKARLNRIIFKEDNMNFFMGGGLGLISQQQTVSGATTTTDTESGFEIDAVVGSEFFLPGLDSLGFSFETGVGVTSLKSGVRFRTIADSPLRAGMIFYF